MNSAMIEHIPPELESRMEASNDNSNGNLNNSSSIAAHQEQANQTLCFRSLKACCKMKKFMGLEDFFWLLFLTDFIAFAAWKNLTNVGWFYWIYLLFGSILMLVLFYIFATAASKMIVEEGTTAHWNAHARFTQAAIQSRLKEEEHAVTVIAPPKMGGAKLNIRYTVGDVPLAQPKGMAGVSRASAGSLGTALGNMTQQTLSTASSIITTGPAALTTGSLPSSSHSSPVNESPKTSGPTTTVAGKKISPLVTAADIEFKKPARESLVPAIIEEEDRIESPSAAPEDVAYASNRPTTPLDLLKTDNDDQGEDSNETTKLTKVASS